MAKPTIVTRAGKGSALTWTEGDANVTNLQNATITVKADTGGTDVVSDLNGTVTLVAGTNVTITGDNTAKTVTINSTASGGSSALDDLTDVVITAAASGEVLYHNGTNWVDTPLSTLLASPGDIGGTTAGQVNFNQLKMSTAALSTTWTSSGLAVVMPAKTITVTDTSGTAASGSVMAIASSTIASTSATTYTNAASLFVQNPTQGTNSTFTNTWAIYGNGRIRATDFTGTIGATTPSGATFTTLSASSTVTLSPVSATVAISPTGTGTVTISPAGALTINPTTASTINNTSIGATTASTGRFTTVTSTVATGTAPFTVASTTNVANLNASSLNGATFAAPGPIGSTTASTGAFTTLTAATTTLDDIRETVAALTYGATITPNAADGSIRTITLTGNVTFSAFTSPVSGQTITLIITQDATGSRTLTSTMKFAGGSKTLSTAANSIDILTVSYIGTTYYASLSKAFA